MVAKGATPAPARLSRDSVDESGREEEGREKWEEGDVWFAFRPGVIREVRISLCSLIT